MTDLKEYTYWQDFIGGCDRAFEELYNMYIDRLYTFGKKYHRDSELVKDSIQDLFTDLYRYRNNINPNVNVRPYLFISLRRIILDKIRKENRAHDLPQELYYTFTLEWSTESQWIQREENQHLYRKLQKLITLLPSRQREAIYLKFHEELSYEEVAELMQVSVATCRTLIYRAIKSIREKVDHVQVIQLLCMVIGRQQMK
ncbi:sigma-70 family RNA polymerase sigma factor [Olivibacter sp. SDN3]|uniref:RNA polymerase sigma factor n=1 Tax=Olivibacter sp. SDN3 TaxID=2764720 RepID=UPI00165195CE|nr:sigma-70 family RNA polymerase sigma factor [Olivibacter sp. SDN3]QNL49145.1 sigma-70 family RNA polymerase sigma factor [Olivibacter sp. SDN3]